MYSVRAASLPIALVAVVNSLLLIGAHARENKHPALRIYTVRILLLVIIDSLTAVCVLWATGWAKEADPILHNLAHWICEFYESVVIFSFLQFVLTCGGGAERLAAKFAKRADDVPGEEGPAGSDDNSNASGGRSAKNGIGAGAASVEELPPLGGAQVEDAAGSGGEGAEAEARQAARRPARIPTVAMGAEFQPRALRHLPGFSYILPPWRTGEQMLRWCVTGTLAYVVVGATLAVLGMFLLLLPGSGEAKSVIWKVSCTLLSAAQASAIMSLGELAVNVKEEIALLRPYGKFLSVKFVVFFAFWQSLVLQGLLKFGVFSGFNSACGDHCAVTIIQNMLVCVEMLAASVFHFYVFPPHDYLRLLAQNRLHYDEKSPCSLGSPPTVQEVVDVRDMFRTAWLVHVQGRPQDVEEEKSTTEGRPDGGTEETEDSTSTVVSV
uniref:Transmembrane protein 184C n=1 Tax=Zooxanthella nutricula TaxID=1333877 RepID=A0A7S2KMH1_9DINO